MQKNQNQIEKRKKGEKIASLWLAPCHWLKLKFTYENKGQRFLQLDTMRQGYHSYTQNFHRNKINWKLKPKETPLATIKVKEMKRKKKKKILDSY